MKPQDMADEDIIKFQERIERRFPELFAKNYGGFEINTGWLTLVETLCEMIHNNHLHKQKYAPDDYYEPVVVEQIKEKFGTLRFYYSGGDEYVNGLVSMAEAISGKTCDVCGGPGKLTGKNWLATRCKEHE